jgi:hypothetical protein
MDKIGNLKISKKMAALLIEAFPEGSLRARIEAETVAERFVKDGAVMIEATSDDIALLYGYALGSMSKLDAELPQAAAEDRHKLLGQHSAWRALVRQVAPMYPTDARHAPPPAA